MARGLVRESQDDAALGAQLVEEDTSGEAARVGGSAWRRGGVIGGNEEQVGIGGVDADGVGGTKLEAGAVDILEERRLRDLTVVRDPVCVLQVGGEESMRVDPALKRIDIVWVKKHRGFRCAHLERPHLPFLVLAGKIGDAGIVGRPEGLAKVAVNEIAGAAGVEVVEDDGAFRSGLCVGANVEEFLAVVGKSEVGPGRRYDFLHGSAAQDDLVRRVDVGHGGGWLESCHGGFGRGLFLGRIVGVVLGLVGDAGKELGGNARAAAQGAELGMLDHRAKRVFCRGHAVKAGFARQVNRDGGSGPSVLGVVGPGVTGRFVSDLGGFQSDGRISGTIQALWTFLPDAQAPCGIISGGEQKNRIVLGLRRRRSCGGGRRLLGRGRRLSRGRGNGACGEYDRSKES